MSETTHKDSKPDPYINVNAGEYPTPSLEGLSSYRTAVEKELASRDLNDLHAIAYDSGKKRLVEMINVYTGEHKALTFWRKVKLLFF